MTALFKKKKPETPVIESGKEKKLYIETYGCQMNVADSEVVAAIMSQHKVVITEDFKEADLIFVNTCSIRENAEQRVRNRLNEFNQVKKKSPHLIIGLIGCMAERLQDKLFKEEKLIDIVVGPDSYRDLPNLIEKASKGKKAINIELSKEETYDDIIPQRLDDNHVSSFVSIMRGCNNMCSYCIVPYTRGRERSRDPKTIMSEIKDLTDKGYKEVTLLGQNVNSYHWKDEKGEELDFSALLEMVANHNNHLRIRFTTSNPKDMSDKILFTIARHNNIAKNIHLPVQSGSNKILELMNRGYTREWYLDRINAITSIIPGCTITTDIFTGFCSETEEDHKQTLSLMQWVQFDFAFMFKYSERPGTYAHKKLKDDISEEVKIQRLNEVIELQNTISAASNQKDIGQIFNVLIEGYSKRSENHFYGRSSQNKVIVFPKEDFQIGDFVDVVVLSCTSATLIGQSIR